MDLATSSSSKKRRHDTTRNGSLPVNWQHQHDGPRSRGDFAPGCSKSRSQDPTPPGARRMLSKNLLDQSRPGQCKSCFPWPHLLDAKHMPSTWNVVGCTWWSAAEPDERERLQMVCRDEPCVPTLRWRLNLRWGSMTSKICRDPSCSGVVCDVLMWDWSVGICRG